jgi:DNA-directed RNA polymerase sigma subunit (sigma70/sigma32)
MSVDRQWKQERQQKIDDLRRKGWTLDEIGRHFGLTRERIRQLTTVPVEVAEAARREWHQRIV